MDTERGGSGPARTPRAGLGKSEGDGFVAWKTLNEGGVHRVVVTHDLPGTRWREILDAADCEVVYWDGDDILPVPEIERAIGKRCHGVIGQLTEPWGAELFECLRAAGGRVFSNYAVGYDNVDVAAATDREIAVGNTPGVLTETTAELAVALTFAAARRIPESEHFLRQGEFHGWLPDLFLGQRLWRGTVGIIGAGRIGCRYAKMMAQACGMDVLYWSHSRSAGLESFFEDYAKFAEIHGDPAPTCRRAEMLDELLTESDVVSIHLPLTEKTRHLIDGTRLAHMKPEAILVNTSRGPIVVEDDLVHHLKHRPEFRCGLDVFENEPALARGLADLPNAVIVPHIGSATVWTRAGMAALAASNITGVLRRFPIMDVLDVEPFLSGAIPNATPSIVNRAELGL